MDISRITNFLESKNNTDSFSIDILNKIDQNELETIVLGCFTKLKEGVGIVERADILGDYLVIAYLSGMMRQNDLEQQKSFDML